MKGHNLEKRRVIAPESTSLSLLQSLPSSQTIRISWIHSIGPSMPFFFNAIGGHSLLVQSTSC